MRMQLSNLSLDDRVASAFSPATTAAPFTPDPHSSRTDEPNFSRDPVVDTYYTHSSAPRTSTDAVLLASIRAAHPALAVTDIIYPSLLTWASATKAATFEPINSTSESIADPFSWKQYLPPTRRLDDHTDGGTVISLIRFGKYKFTYRSTEYLLYVADCRDGNSGSYRTQSQYIVHAKGEKASAAIETLIRAAGSWTSRLHDEIWVFDSGYWQKDAKLFASVQKARWSDVILDEKEKKALRGDASRFFDGRERYERLRVAWKRGVIYHGPPGNGKTVSIKALMHELYQRTPAVPTLYVKSLSSFGGPEASVRNIFSKARAEAPCLLVFEDLDSIVTDAVRSYFLNEVDGLASNDGVLMVASTNHLDRLDPGLSKRPSRFDRKFYFPKPDRNERKLYAAFWRKKLADNEDIEFPEELEDEVAKITDGFSFAYIQEAFVATLLAIAGKEDGDDDDNDSDGKDKFDRLILWREFKKAVKTLRDEM